jgi:hypothetical protein
MKYHLGCGSQYLSGYINVDFPSKNHNVNHNVVADIYTDILHMSYEDCEEIRSHHFFEHFNYFDTMVLLYNWTNSLKLGGQLVIDLPDLEALCQAYLSADDKTKFLVVRYLYGSHEADWAYHINGWSKNTLEYILIKLGYTIQNVIKYGNFTDQQPNCGITITAILEIKNDSKEIKKQILEFLQLYKNGNTDFENSLYDYFVKKWEQKIQ